MIEVPAAALSLAQFLRYFDFVSIGTNDLIQYTLAIDRADDAVSHLYDPWHPAVLGLIASVDRAGQCARARASACAARWRATPRSRELLLAMGLRSFSMHPAQIPSIKQRILRADTRRLSGALERVLASDESAGGIRAAPSPVWLRSSAPLRATSSAARLAKPEVRAIVMGCA